MALGLALGLGALLRAAVAAGSGQSGALTVVNPGAESGVTGWTNVTGVLVADTNLDGTEYAPHGGSFTFRLGTAATYEGYQDISVSDYATAIDAGSFLLRMQWWGAGLVSPDGDVGRMEMSFRDVGGVELGRAANLNDTPTSSRGWLQSQCVGIAPANTRTIRLHMYGARTLGSELSYYIDDITLDYWVVNTTTLTVTNPGAESGVTGWTNVTGTLASGAFNTAGEPGPHTGAAAFRLGASQTYEGYQDISVSSYATAIDAGSALATLEWWQGGWTSDTDGGRMALVFLNGSGTEISRVTQINGDVDAWLKRAVGGPIPANTRTLRLTMLGTRAGASGNLNCYIDDVAAYYHALAT